MVGFSSQPDQLPVGWDAGDVLCAKFWGALKGRQRSVVATRRQMRMRTSW